MPELNFDISFIHSEYNENNKIKYLLNDLFVREQTLGYKYLMEAVSYTMKGDNVSRVSSRQLCFLLGAKFDVTPKSIESSLLHAIDKAWKRAGNDRFSRILDYTFENKKPSISSLIKTLTYKLADIYCES